MDTANRIRQAGQKLPLPLQQQNLPQHPQPHLLLQLHQEQKLFIIKLNQETRFGPLQINTAV